MLGKTSFTYAPATAVTATACEDTGVRRTSLVDLEAPLAGREAA